jgi:DNA-binding transcriptional MerR regulator
VTDAGYRYYDDTAIERLWQILFYRELDFPLRDIAEILSSPGFDRMRALSKHRALLLQKRDRLDKLIELVSNAMKGETTMEFKPFDTGELDAMREQYAEEAKARWEIRKPIAKARAAPQSGPMQTARAWSSAQTRFSRLCGARRRRPRGRTRSDIGRTLEGIHRRSYYDCTNEILAVSGRCTSRTNALRRISTASARARQSSCPTQSQSTVPKQSKEPTKTGRGISRACFVDAKMSMACPRRIGGRNKSAFSARIRRGAQAGSSGDEYEHDAADQRRAS